MSSDIYNAALGLLARRDHSIKELKAKLQIRFSVASGEMDALLSALIDSGYLDDKRFAAAYVRSRIRKGFGPERIRLELREKGVDENFVSEVLSSEDPDWHEMAKAVWRKKYRNPPVDFKERVKQSNFLRYRGFTSEHYSSVLDSKSCESMH